MLFNIPGASYTPPTAKTILGDSPHVAISDETPSGSGPHTVATVDCGALRGSYNFALSGTMCDITGSAYPIHLQGVVVANGNPKLQLFGVRVKTPCWNLLVDGGTNLTVTLEASLLHTQVYSLSITVRAIDIDPKEIIIRHATGLATKTQRFF